MKDAGDWLDMMHDDVFGAEKPCIGCPYHHTYKEPYPFDVEPRLQVVETFRECEAGDPKECPEIQHLLKEMCD